MTHSEFLTNNHVLKNENTDSKPFACPLLIVLPDDTTVKNGDDWDGDEMPDSKFLKGSLLCAGRHDYCNIAAQEFKLNSDGKAELRCSWNNSVITLDVVGFRTRVNKRT